MHEMSLPETITARDAPNAMQLNRTTQIVCTLSLLQDLLGRLGRRFIDLLVGDALYLQTPFVGAVEDLGLDWVINLKENQPELLAEAERLTDRAHDDSCSGLHSDPSVLPSPGSQPLQKLLFRFLRFGSEAGVSIYCYSSAGFQLKPSYN